MILKATISAGISQPSAASGRSQPALTPDPVADCDKNDGFDCAGKHTFLADAQHSSRKYDELIKRCKITPPVTPRPFLTKYEVLQILCKICNQQSETGLTELISSLEQSSGTELTLEFWARISLAMEQLSTQFARVPECSASGIAPQNHIKINVRYLQQVSHYSWAQLSHDQLVAFFARDIERQAVDNPALNETRSVKGGLEASTAFSFLSAGAELRLQQSRSVDDDGNYVMAQQVTGSVTCNLSVLFAFLKTKVTGTLGTSEYGRSARDHARHLFKQLVADNRKLPALAKFLSRSAAAGQTVSQSAVSEEITHFDHLKNAYLLQQDVISRSLSIFIGGAAPVSLNAVATPKARVTQAIVTGKAVSGQAGAGFTLHAGVKLETSTRTVHSSRVSTLCELLKNQYVGAEFKARMKQDIVVGGARIRSRVLDFWYGDSAPANAHELLAEHIVHFNKDWQHYRHLHAMHSQGHASTGACLEAFHKKYGAKNTGQCLRAMALLLADMYARLLDQNAGDELDQMKNDVLTLERELHESSIPGAREILARHAVARQKIEYSSNEKFVHFYVGCNAQAECGNPGVKIATRSVHHYNPWRCGDEVTVEFMIGSALEQNRQVLKAVGDYFKSGATGLHAHFGIDTYSRQGVHTVRFFKPSLLPGLPFSKLYERRVTQTNLQFGADATIPVTGALGLRASFGYTATSNQLESETIGTQTMLYLARNFMQAYSSGKTDSNDKVLQDSYWYRIEREHGTELGELFLNFASHHRKKIGLSRELDAIEQSFLRSTSELEACRSSRRKMLALTQQLERSRSAENFQAALAGLKGLMKAYYPHWQRKKEQSGAYKKWQYSF